MLVASVLSGITDAVTGLIGDYGIYAVFALMAVDAILPTASELVMVYGGALAAGAFVEHEVSLFGQVIEPGIAAVTAIVVAGALGYLIGAIVGWGIGAAGGRPLLERHGRWFHLDEAKLDRAEEWFARHGDFAVFLGRVTPVVRSFISIPAGVFRASLGRYTTLTAVGSLLWCVAFAGIGWAAGKSWERFHHDFRYADYTVGAIVVVGVAWLGWRMHSRRRAAV